MPVDFLHQHPDFNALLDIAARNEGIGDPSLMEKDYWIMHGLYLLKEADNRVVPLLSILMRVPKSTTVRFYFGSSSYFL